MSRITHEEYAEILADPNRADELRGVTVIGKAPGEPRGRWMPKPIIDDEDLDLDNEVIHFDGVRLTEAMADQIAEELGRGYTCCAEGGAEE